MQQTTVSAPPKQTNRLWLLMPLVLFALVSLTIGIAAQHTAHLVTTPPFKFFFTDFLHLKVWFVTAAAFLAVMQVITATRVYERIKFPPSTQFWAFVHRWSGRTAITLTLPVAYHCILVLGYDVHTPDTRVLAHALMGSALYGAFIGKVWIVRGKGFPSWALPVAGGVLFSLLLGIWATSSLWFFSTAGASF